MTLSVLILADWTTVSKKADEEKTGAISGLKGSPALLCFVSLTIIVVIPIVVMLLYSVDSPNAIKTPWSAGDMLGYCGTMGAAFIALLGIVYGVFDAWEQQRVQSRKSIAPYFSMVILAQKNRKGLSSMPPFGIDNTVELHTTDAGFREISNEYCEVDERATYVIIGNKIEYKDGLNSHQWECVKSKYMRMVVNGLELTLSNETIYAPLRFTNTGPGCATNVRVGVYPKGEEWRGIRSMTLDHGESFYLGIYIDTENCSPVGNYELGIAYYDCFGYRYMQTFDLNVEKEENGPYVSKLEYVGRKAMIADPSSSN